MPVTFVLGSFQPNASSDSALGLYRTWFEECSTKHKSCTYRNDDQLPRRLLDIRSSKENDGVRLGDTANNFSRYCALSYCWGGSTPPSLRKDNCIGLYSGIPWDSLPQCYRDAILVTRSLGIGYLWIDSFCIMQDSKEDWAIESAKMGGIYPNAALVIIAAKSSRPDEGFLVRNDEGYSWSTFAVPGSHNSIKVRKETQR